ncbi:MAG: Holliday junction branch migration protein RuvA [Candidatus Pacebacteria bacterium]|nr:Holliday junction branch migration protein RuvA [Candidatus Paceibacterota bacterium]
MISYIEGEVLFKGKDFIILKTAGVGFKVFVLPGIDATKEKIGLYTHLAVREDALTLFGFVSYEELELFETLISVSGIGPKAGLGILSLADPATVKTAIVREDASILTRVSGIGKKTADRVILELKNKFTFADITEGEAGEKQKALIDHQDVVEALMGLGYGQNEVRKVLEKIPKESSLEDKIKLALKELGKNK